MHAQKSVFLDARCPRTPSRTLRCPRSAPKWPRWREGHFWPMLCFPILATQMADFAREPLLSPKISLAPNGATPTHPTQPHKDTQQIQGNRTTTSSNLTAVQTQINIAQAHIADWNAALSALQSEISGFSSEVQSRSSVVSSKAQAVQS